MAIQFSSESRRESFSAMVSRPVDIFIIGGGITGAGIARDAAMRGLKVGLVEQGDFASGTSSRSSKLIHGGLRYLEQYAFSLVRQSCMERITLNRIAPHLCEPLGFHLPIYDTDRHSPIKLRAGLFLYDALCHFKNFKSHQILSPEEVGKQIPHLKTQGLRLGGLYYDALTNDARLTLSTLKSAALHGAMVANRVELLDFRKARGLLDTARVRDLLTGEEGEVKARIFINATGPWSDRIRRMADPGAESWLRLSKGTHIILKRERLPVPNAIGFANPSDGRTMFLIPWEGRTLVGTTDTDYSGEIEEVRPTREDVDYLLSPIQALFPDQGYAVTDVMSSYAGLRPLIGSDAATPSDVSREHRVEIEPSGLLTVAGGKLTTYRQMAKDVVDKALVHLKMTGAIATSSTELEALVPGPRSRPNLEALPEFLAQSLRLRYGDEAEYVAELSRTVPGGLAPLWESPLLIEAQVRFAVLSEMALDLEDVLARRLPVLFTHDDRGAGVARRAVAIMGEILGWDGARQEEELARYQTVMLVANPTGSRSVGI